MLLKERKNTRDCSVVFLFCVFGGLELFWILHYESSVPLCGVSSASAVPERRIAVAPVPMALSFEVWHHEIWDSRRETTFP